MKLKFEINGASVTLNIDDKDIKEWEMKRDEFEPQSSLEMFIVKDIRNLVKHEIDYGDEGLFNY